MHAQLWLRVVRYCPAHSICRYSTRHTPVTKRPAVGLAPSRRQEIVAAPVGLHARLCTKSTAKVRPDTLDQLDNPWDYAKLLQSQKKPSPQRSGKDFDAWLRQLRTLATGEDNFSASLLTDTQYKTSKTPDAADGQGERLDPKNAYVAGLTNAQQLDRELVLAHLLVLRVKGEAKRGRHQGSYLYRGMQQPGWQYRGDVRATQVALLTQAHRLQCSGLVLNLLLDWKNHVSLVSWQLLELVRLSHCVSARQLAESVRRSAVMYQALVLDSSDRQQLAEDAYSRETATGFVDGLWRADNLQAAIDMLRSLVERQHKAGQAPVDQMLASLAIRTMQIASEFDERQKAFDVFALCKPWPQHSADAYNVLLHKPAMMCHTDEVQNGAVPDSHVWTLVIDGMCRNHRVKQAMSLFSLHLLFLPREPSADGHTADGAQQKASISKHIPLDAKLDVWRAWYKSTDKEAAIDPFIRTWLHELADMHHRDSTVRPWLPSAATHRLMLDYLGRAGMMAEMMGHCTALEQLWDQYRRWLYLDKPAQNQTLQYWDGFRGLEKLALRRKTQHDMKKAHTAGLHQIDDPTGEPTAYEDGGYSLHCQAILELAKRDTTQKARPEPESGSRELP
ncbi:hypothetical protein IWW50_004165, partial [Coemansia erecta]